MASDPLLPYGLMAAVALVAAGGACWRWYRRRVRRQQRQASWKELLLRLELVPQEGDGRVARGELRDANFLLHDTGADWLVEVPLAQPLLPPGMVLLSREAPTLQPGLKLRALEWGAAGPPPERLSWCVDGKEPAGKVVLSQAFLEEASRAVQAHAPLRVEPHRMVQALRAGALLSGSEVREAVKALAATARGWSEVASREGLPQVQPLSPPPTGEAPLQPVQAPSPAKDRRSGRARRRRQETQPQSAPEAPTRQPSLRKRVALLRQTLGSVLSRRATWGAVFLLNLGVIGCGGLALFDKLEDDILFPIAFIYVMGSAAVVEFIHWGRGYTLRGFALWFLALAANVLAPAVWSSSLEVALLLWGGPHAVWLVWVLLHWRREFRRVSEGGPARSAAAP